MKLFEYLQNLDTAIHLACANSHSGSLRLLLSAFPYSSPKNAQGDTPLHVSVRFGHVTCSRVLISSKCNVNLQNKVIQQFYQLFVLASDLFPVGIFFCIDPD